MCSRLCEQEPCCDEKGVCSCGSKTGRYECVCGPGTQGSGYRGDCHDCSIGTYKDYYGHGTCKACPRHSTNVITGSNSLRDCSCDRGFKGDPGSGQDCTPVTCAPFQAPAGGVMIPEHCDNEYRSSCHLKCLSWQGYVSLPDMPLESNCGPTGKWDVPELSCHRVTCPRLEEREHCLHNCSSSDYYYGTVCNLTCNEGSKLRGSSQLTCELNGEWSGTNAGCEVVTCPPLKMNKKLKVHPHECSLESRQNGTVCKYYCVDGFRLLKGKHDGSSIDVQDDGWRVCTPSGEWTDTGVPITCSDVSPPRFTYCPDDIVVPTDHQIATALVDWQEPSAADNDGAAPIVKLIEPALYFEQKIFSIGETRVIYVAIDASGLEANCTFSVKVIDDDPPLIIFCPTDVEIFHDKRKKAVLWDEPRFRDNSGADVYIYKSREPGDVFTWGQPSEVIYTATDNSGNTAVCSFSVKVKPYSCPYHPPPENGALSCDTWQEGQYCTVQCQEGFDFSRPSEEMYYCRQMDGYGAWEPLVAHKIREFKFPWPDCSVKRHPNEAETGLKMQYFIGNCQSQKSQLEIQQNYLETLQQWTPFLQGLCDNDMVCKIERVNVTCSRRQDDDKPRGPEPDDYPTGQELQHPNRDNFERNATAIDDAYHDETNTTDLDYYDAETEDIFSASRGNLSESGTDGNVTYPLGRERRQIHREPLYKPMPTGGPGSQPPWKYVPKAAFPKQTNPQINPKFFEQLDEVITMDLILTVGRNISSWDDLAANSDFMELIYAALLTVQAGLNQHMGTLGMQGEVNFIPKLHAVVVTEKPYPTGCGAGQMLHNNTCFNCPKGTYYNPEYRDCVGCLTGTYQDEEGQLDCKECPDNKTTIGEGGNAVSDCRVKCKPGHYSTTRLEPCLACPAGTYQPGHGENECTPCPNKLTTLEGAQLESECTTLCPKGYFSETGNQDCYSCPRGFYQSSLGQKGCINCPEGQSTETTGSRFHTDCRDINECELQKPCKNGASCVDLPGNYQCSCITGFTGLQCEINTDDCGPDLCENNGTCVDGVDAYSCDCAPGFSGDICERDIDDCFLNPCMNKGVCNDMINSFSCTCQPGYSGERCEIKDSKCTSIPCQNNGTCFDTHNNFTCCCLENYVGLFCEIYIPYDNATSNETMVTDSCASSPCQQGGTCYNFEETFVCKCRKGYHGEQCEIEISYNYDMVFQTRQITNYAMYVGEIPDLYALTLAFWMRTDDTQNQGTPVSYACERSDGRVVDNALTLNDYSNFMVYINNMPPMHTDVKANSDNSWHHIAATWDSIDGKLSMYLDGELRKDSQNVSKGVPICGGGSFVLGQEQDSVGGTFNHAEVYVGELTQVNLWDYAMDTEEINVLNGSCGFYGNVIAWPDLKDLTYGLVNIHAISTLCHDLSDCSPDESCHCASSVQLESCALDVVNCSRELCLNDQPCVTTPGGAYCNCSAGFSGKYCQYDINECSFNNGDCSHACVNTIGSHYCECDVGWKLDLSDNRTCLDAAYCRIDDKYFLAGEKWKTNCTTCVCRAGRVDCEPLECPSRCPEFDQQLYHRPGDCCAICIAEQIPCHVTRHNTYITLDYVNFNFDGSCRYVLSQDCADMNFTIHVESDMESSQRKTLYVYLNCVRFVVRSGAVFLNDTTQVALPYVHPSFELAASRDEDGILEIKTHVGVSITWKPAGDIIVQIPKSYQGKLCGLCGSFHRRIDYYLQSVPGNKQFVPGKIVKEFIKSWTVEGTRYCRVPKFVSQNPLRELAGEEAKGACRGQHQYQQRQALKACSVFREPEFTQCYSIVDPREYYRDCLTDMCLCRPHEKRSCHCDAAIAYTEACLEQGVVIRQTDRRGVCTTRRRDRMDPLSKLYRREI
ncbi:PREDICTED: sushi, von Willebrand factor type A, EGF and pentraxin domain-containing protein 1-like [Priapulus caudatus]|uniref:Sushi, von Willebrand factor type A, EGF and pentraxin domain-containing protein 1-like n=1 Tax=Priapulus caudatus TaxID=37621 RepID=A0ABM1EGI4_PRICU|nr:PREDICTED: sushi, von Willebrand factor type A, EGF and pentraxin domain-containing protein 1-like [Priapulus caudatus]